MTSVPECGRTAMKVASFWLGYDRRPRQVSGGLARLPSLLTNMLAGKTPDGILYLVKLGAEPLQLV